MDRYSRGYDERYRSYYERPRSDTYRPGENYRSEREYRDGGVRGGRNYSPNHHYSSGNSRGGGNSGNGNEDRYSYTDSRQYYPPSRGPSPSRSDSRSPRRPSYGYYRSGPSSYPYNSRRSPSPANGGRSGSSGRRDSYDHRPYHNSPNYPYPYHRNSSPYPPYSSRRHYSGPPPSYPPAGNGSGYHSRESSVGPSSLQQQHQPPLPQQQRSLHSTPTSTAPNSPGHMNYNPIQPSVPSVTNQPLNDATTITTPNTTTNVNNTNTPQTPSSLSLNTSYPPSYPYVSPATSSTYIGGGGSGSNAPIRPHHHNYHHNSHYNSNYQSHHSSPSVTMPPMRQRISWAPDQEKEVKLK